MSALATRDPVSPLYSYMHACVSIHTFKSTTETNEFDKDLRGLPKR